MKISVNLRSSQIFFYLDTVYNIQHILHIINSSRPLISALIPYSSSSQCDLIHGECVQTYVPYLFLVIPLGPVTLTGQDYVLVESGCTCRPKYAQPGTDPNPTSIIPNF